MTFEMRLDKVSRSGDRLFVLFEGRDCSLHGYIQAAEGDVPDFEHVYVVKVEEAE